MTDLVNRIGELAKEALLQEVTLSPKPGLVDRYNNGSHNDMDLAVFMVSVEALAPYLKAYLGEGFYHTGTPQELFQKVRQIGKEAENTMLKATKQVNTHKGANFSFAILLSAVGYCLKEKGNAPFFESDITAIFNYSQLMCSNLISKDLKNLEMKKELTNGEKLYLTLGVTGIRGEAEAGYPAIKDKLLPFLRTHQELEFKERYLRGLLLLMRDVQDSNIYHRGGTEGIEYVQTVTKTLLEKSLSKDQLFTEVSKMDQSFIEKRLSPGGAADLLALGIFFDQLLSASYQD